MFIYNAHVLLWTYDWISVVTVIEIGTETAVFRQNRTEPKPRFYPSLLAVSKTELL